MEMLNVAVPSKGAMEEPTLRFLAECGVAVRRANPRHTAPASAAGAT